MGWHMKREEEEHEECYELAHEEGGGGVGKDMDVDNREIEREGRKVQEGIKIWVLSGSQHTSRLLQQPHWLLIPSRVRYKYNCLTILHFFCQNFETPSFLSSVFISAPPI